MAGAIAPGSALSCLDEIAEETVEAACEKAVFASPEAVAAGIKHVTSQLALLDDGTTYAERGDASYAAELAPLRTALELDRFGIVAHVLGDQGCTPENCDALIRFHDSSKVLANLRDRTFEKQVKKYAAIWDRPADGVAATASPPVALPDTIGPEVGQKYGSPSSKSIPPVSIVAPEESQPREATASESTDVTPQPAPQAPQPTPPLAGGEPAVQSAVVTPLPPHRPPQRAQTLRPATPPQLPPIDLPGTPPPPPGPIR
jgi:hypothetical protein